MPPSSKVTFLSQETEDSADRPRRVEAALGDTSGGILTWDAGTETSLSPEGTGEGGATCGCRVGVLPAPPGEHGSPETVLTASSGTKFPRVAGQWTAGSGIGVNNYSEPSMVTNSLPCPHGTCRPILPLTAPLAWAALGLRIPAQCRQQAGEPAQGQGMAAPKDPVLMDLEFTRSGSHREQEKHSQGRAMGKGPPAVALPAPAAAVQPSLASQTAHT